MRRFRASGGCRTRRFALLFEIGVLFALLRFVPARWSRVVWIACWLNPWFIWHGAFQGFWEGPHILFGLLAVLALRRDAADVFAGGDAFRPAPRAWALCGVLLFISWQFKPQGLLHFAAPLGLLLALHFWRGRRQPLWWYAGGLAVAAALTSLLIWSAGGSLFALVDNVRSTGNEARLSNGAPGLWRFVVAIYMQVRGIAGEVYTLRLPPVWVIVTSGAAMALSLAILAAFAWRLRGQGPTARDAYLMLAAGTLVMSQFAPRAHINHTYGAMVLLIPLLPLHRRLRLAWIAAVAVQAYAHVSRYAMGTPLLLPPDRALPRYEHSGPLVDLVRAVPAYASGDGLLRAQTAVNDAIAQLPGHVFVSMMSVVMFAAAVVMLRALFEIASGPGRPDVGARA